MYSVLTAPVTSETRSHRIIVDFTLWIISAHSTLTHSHNLFIRSLLYLCFYLILLLILCPVFTLLCRSSFFFSLLLFLSLSPMLKFSLLVFPIEKCIPSFNKTMGKWFECYLFVLANTLYLCVRFLETDKWTKDRSFLIFCGLSLMPCRKVAHITTAIPYIICQRAKKYILYIRKEAEKPYNVKCNRRLTMSQAQWLFIRNDF